MQYAEPHTKEFQMFLGLSYSYKITGYINKSGITL